MTLSTRPERTLSNAALSDPELRLALVRFLRSRLPECEVDDAVQETLADALASASPPSSLEQIRGWVHGIARHKVADFYRRRDRLPAPLPGDDSLADPVPEGTPFGARELLDWADQQVTCDSGHRATLEWMLREGDGDRLQEIAREADLPAARVRQRVSRLRRFLRSRWAAEISAAAGVITLALLVVWWLLSRPTDVPIVHEAPRPAAPNLQRARGLRERALHDCDAGLWRRCVAGLDAAKKLDPDGDRAGGVKAARRAAATALSASPPERAKPASSSRAKPSPSTSSSSPVVPPSPKPPSSAPRSVPSSTAPTRPRSTSSLRSSAPKISPPFEQMHDSSSAK